MTSLAIPYSARHYRASFAWLLFGFLLTIIDLRINGFDVLPDCIGCVVMAVAASQLRRLDALFGVACAAAVVMTPLAILSQVTQSSLSSETGNPGLDAVWGIAELVLMWSVCTGVLHLALGAGDPDSARRMRVRRAWIVTVQALFVSLPVLVPALSLQPAGLILVLMIAYVAASLIALVMLIRLLHGARALVAA